MHDMWTFEPIQSQFLSIGIIFLSMEATFVTLPVPTRVFYDFCFVS